MNITKNNKSMIIIPIIVSIILFMEYLDITIINTAVPSIAQNFAISPILLKFAVSSYFLGLAIFIPISGWCADRFGNKTILIMAVAIFGVASLFCALSNNIVTLTFWRFMQGIGGSFMTPIARIIVIRIFPPKDLVRMQSLVFTPALLGQIVGPFFGGVIVHYLTWHWIFYINIPIAIIVIIFVNKYIVQNHYPTAKFDYFGFLYTAISLSLFTFSVDMIYHYDLISKHTVGLMMIIAIIFFIILVIHCLFRQNAIFAFNLFKINSFNVGFSINLSNYLLGAAVAFLLPLMFQEVLAFSAIKSGFLLLPIACGTLLFRALASKVIPFFGFKKAIILGSVILIVTISLLGTINTSTTTAFIIIVEFVLGAAWVLIGASVGALNYIDMPKDKVSSTASLDMTFRQFSSSFGVGVATILLTYFSNYLNVNIFHNILVFHYTFYFLAFIVTFNIINALRLQKNLN